MTKTALAIAVLGAVALAATASHRPAQAADPTDDLTMTISPSVVVLDNPAEWGQRHAGTQFRVSVTSKNSAGHGVLPSAARPIVLNVYQPVGGPIRPSTASITSASDPSATFTYDGAYFANPMILTATMGDASASTSITRANPLRDCDRAVGHDGYTISYPDPIRTLQHGFTVAVSVGGGQWHTGIELDTGSLGLTIARSSLGPQAIGPGEPNSREYYPSGLKVVGNYWLAPVTVAIPSRRGGPGKVVTTVPVEVFAISKVECGADVKTCKPPVDQEKAIAGFGLLGIGFDRGGAPPSNNVFLQLEDVVYGGMHPGYVFSPDQVSIGLDRADTAEDFQYVELGPNPNPRGDWLGAEGYFSFPAASRRFCGSMLLDTGIDGMIFALAKSKRPAEVVDPLDPVLLRPGTDVDISAPTERPLALSYGFTYRPENGRLIEPKQIQWAAAPSPTRPTTPPVFFNIGRTPLARYDYLYDARCGRVGFFDRMTAR
jgi:hypothetical protein